MAKRKAKRPPSAIIAFMLQGQPRVIVNEDGYDPHVWASVKEALEWAGDAIGNGHMGLTAAESIVIVDIATGESESV